MLMFRHKPYGFNKKMPIENISLSQNQGRFFEEELSKKLNPKNKLYRLRDLVNWSELEEKALGHIEIKQFGRNRKPHRVMLGLLMLQPCIMVLIVLLNLNCWKICIGNIFVIFNILKKIREYRKQLLEGSVVELEGMVMMRLCVSY